MHLSDKPSKSDEAIKNYVKGLAHVVLGTGITTIADYMAGIRNHSIDSPFADIAVGAGLAGGYNIGKNKDAGVAASLTAFAGSVAPYLLEFGQNGDLRYLGTKIALKTVEYCVGAVIGYIFSYDGKSKDE